MAAFVQKSQKSYCRPGWLEIGHEAQARSQNCLGCFFLWRIHIDNAGSCQASQFVASGDSQLGAGLGIVKAD